MKIHSGVAALVISTFSLPLVSCHDEHNTPHHDQVPMSDDWASKHMAEEHHINTFDSGSFFNLHDYDSSGFWSRDDILKTYGLKDPSMKHLTPDQRDAVVNHVLEIFDKDHSGTISYAEFIEAGSHGQGQGQGQGHGAAADSGADPGSYKLLPDFGHGQGHHGDDEYEYEIHHFEKFHGPDTTEEDLVHPEDIAHFKHHDDMEDLEAENARLDAMPVVEHNIPAMFLRHV